MTEDNETVLAVITADIRKHVTTATRDIVFALTLIYEEDVGWHWSLSSSLDPSAEKEMITRACKVMMEHIPATKEIGH